MNNPDPQLEEWRARLANLESWHPGLVQGECLKLREAIQHRESLNAKEQQK